MTLRARTRSWAPLALLLLFCARSAHSEDKAFATDLSSASDDRLLLHAQELESSGRSFRLQGIVFTTVGTGCLATGIVELARSACDANIDCSGARWILLAAGAPTLAYGIVTWALG